MIIHVNKIKLNSILNCVGINGAAFKKFLNYELKNGNIKCYCFFSAINDSDKKICINSTYNLHSLLSNMINYFHLGDDKALLLYLNEF